jgi:hypothetical protein
MSFQGEDVTIQGSKDSGMGWISCHGQKWCVCVLPSLPTPRC